MISTNPIEALIAKGAIQAGEALALSNPGIAQLIFSATTTLLVSLKILTVLVISLAAVYVSLKLQTKAIDMGCNWLGIKMGILTGYVTPIFFETTALPVIGLSFAFGGIVTAVCGLFSRFIGQTGDIQR